MYAIMRRACIMEDEGRNFLVKVSSSKEEAQKWIDSQKDEYFKPSDYYILESMYE